MGTQNKEIKIALDIQAKIDKASSQINNLKKQIDNFELSKGLAGDFAKEFKNIEHEIAELQRKTASGEINLIDAKSAEKEIDKIEKRWAFLLSKIGGDGFLEKGLKADAQAMAALESLAKSYANGIKEAEAQEAKLNKKLDEAKQKQKELTEAQKEQKVVKAAELEDQKAQLALLKQQEKAAKKTRDEAEKALRTKVEESGGKYSMAEASQKGSPLRKTDAYRTFRDASAAYETAKASTRAQQSNVNSMVTKEMQVAEATAAKEAIDKATEALENYRKTSLATAKEDAFEKAKESLKSIAEFKDIDWEGLDINMSEIKSVEDLEKALAKLRVEADKRANDAIKEMETSTKEAGQGFKGMEEDVKNAKESLEGLDEQARQTEAFEARIKQFLGMAGAVELLRRALRQAFETTKELDAAMTEMAVVTDLEVGDYWKQLPDHTKRASELGVAIHSVYEAETLYYQQGLKTAEAQELANTTLRMARIAGLDAAEATDKMTAALRGFNMELNEASAEKVADVYSELAAITAADVNEISSAMTKTASIASSAGMEFETTAAFLSQIIETTRESAETAGTAMKTVIARFSEVKKLQGEGLLTGSDEEGEVIDVNKIQTALRSVGISMDEFFAGTEGLDSIFLKLAEKWDTLDVKTQRYIATTAAGSRQQSRFIAMMSDYARTQELVTAANNSAGASQKQYEKTLESLESKLAKLKNAWDEFSMGILQSDLVKFGVDALTTFLEIINKATSALDGLGGTITKVLTTIALFKLGQKIFDGIKKPMANFFTKLVSDIYTEGTKAGQAFAKGVEDSKKTEEQKKEEAKKAEDEKRKQYLDVKESRGVLQKIGEFTGISNFGKQALINEKEEYDFKKLKTLKQEGGKKKYEKDYLDAKKKFDDINARKKNGEIIDQKEIDEATQSLIDAEDALVHYKKTEEKVREASQKGWENVGQGFQKMGTAIAGVGVGMSMLGGIFSQLGLEEVGEGFSQIGNVLTVVGGAVSVLGTIVPVVAKIMAAAGFTVQAAWWPLLVALLAIAAAVAIVVGAIAAIKAHNAQKLENRMAAAAEATEKAKEEAEAAKEAYDDLLSDRSEYDEMQKNLENLTYGTKEWKEALHEVNQQVLKLIQTYPELAKYLERGDEGQLTISDQGWDAFIEQQRKAVNNTQSVVLSRQIDEQKLKEEKVSSKKFLETTEVYSRKDEEGNTVYTKQGFGEGVNEEATKQFRKQLSTLYTSGFDTKEVQSELKKLADLYNISLETLQELGDELQKTSIELDEIAEETENIARASLTAQASDDLLNHEFGDDVIDAFAQSVGGKWEEDQKDEKTENLKEAYKGWGKELQTNEDFQELANKYNVDYSSGSDKQNLQELYAAMTGKSMQDVKDSGMSKADLAEAIAEIEVNSDRNTKMEEYLKKLDSLDSSTARDVSSLFSDDGRTMSSDFVNEAVKNDGTFDKAAIEKRAEAMGMTVDEWAESLGKTTEDFWKEAEENARSAKETNKRTYDQLNRVLGKNSNEIQNFGDNVVLSTENQAGLTEKFVGVTQVAGQEAGNALKASLDDLLGAANDNADELAGVLNTVNWHDAESLEDLPTILEEMGISVPTDKLNNFIQQIQNTGIVVDTVNLEKLNSDLTNTRELIKSIQSGEQGRTFTKENYDTLVAANEDIANQFVQIGDEFHYVGTSLQDVADTLKQNMVMELGKASYQLEKQIQVGESMRDFSQGRSENQLNALNGTNNWTEDQKRQYLEEYRAYAVQNDVDTLSYVTDEKGQSLGMSLGMNFDEASEEQMDAYIAGLVRLEGELEKNTTELSQTLSNQRIAQYRMESASSIVSNASAARTANDEVKADEYSKALSIEAATTGLVAESVISEYNELVGRDLKSLNSDELARMSTLEATMESAIEDNTVAIEDLQAVNEMTNRVAQALETARQHEIDELSNINNSINEANQAMVDKLQQQINETRKQRQNEKTEEAIADKQSRLAYLMADSSGAGALEAQALQEQILAEQESYQDNLIDQGLQKLSDENAAAADQRERQIAILEAQLAYAQESGELMREAEMITQQSLAQINQGVNPLETQIYDVLAAEEEINGGMVTNTQQDEFNRNFNEKAVAAAEAQDRLDEGVSKVATQDTLANLNDWLQGQKDKEVEEKEAAVQEIDDEKMRNNAIALARQAIKSSGTGYRDIEKNSQYQGALETFTQYGGNKDNFLAEVSKGWSTDTGKVVGVKANGLASSSGLMGGDYDQFTIKVNGEELSFNTYHTNKGNGESSLNGVGNPPQSKDEHAIALYQGIPYLGRGGRWTKINWEDSSSDLDALKQYLKKQLNTYETGGLADFTGPAWLDGTKSHPELVLNQRDTQNFIQLKDILADIMSNPSDSKKSSGDNYYTIDINVEELKDDYDVEQLANKIRSMLHDDAMYRNVNAISHIR